MRDPRDPLMTAPSRTAVSCRAVLLAAAAVPAATTPLRAAAPPPPPPALVAHWDAREARGDVLPDLTGHGHDGRLVGVAAMRKVEDLVERPYLAFDGTSGHVVIPDRPALNPPRLSVVAWVNVAPGSLDDQKPVLVKSLPSHQPPWYQYGLFLLDRPETPRSAALYLSAGGALQSVTASDIVDYDTWQCLAGTFDGVSLRLYVNGAEAASAPASAAVPIDTFGQPLLLGAYGNLPREGRYCFGGAIASVRLYDGALDAAALRALYEAEKGAFPAAAQKSTPEAVSEYARRLNEALRQKRDVWGEALIAEGGATYERIAGFLHPLFFSTGDTYKTMGPHNLIFGEDNGRPPFIVPLADGSRIAATRYDSPRRLEVFVGPDGAEPFGADPGRLAGPALEGGWYPILQTGYSDAAGNAFQQESFAGRVPDLKHLAAFVRFRVVPAPGQAARLTVSVGQTPDAALRCSPAPQWSGRKAVFSVPPGASEQTVYVLWSPAEDLPPDTAIDAASYAAAKDGWKAYWDRTLAAGAAFEVPEALAMDAQRNLLVQNLIMRWRYTLGPVVYHGDFYQPESSDAMSILALYGFADAARLGLHELLPLTKGPDAYSNWEAGEKLTHGAHYFLLTRDRAFIDEHTPAYAALCQTLAGQAAGDPNGLLHKQRHCGDIPAVAYCTFHQTVCWRGLRDMATVWGLLGRDEEAARTRRVADALRKALRKAVDAASTRLPDGSLFVPAVLCEKSPVYDPITATRLGSYWNLCMPYAFASGFWDPAGEELGAILEFLHGHGATLLGLTRFNYYPVPVGAHRPNGLPGYCTTGFDNVYLPNYLRLLSDRDEADRLVLSFYGKLAHGMTRGTFVNGEGETVGEVPGERFRSCYGTPNSANNSAYLLALRLMLVRESWNPDTGLPEDLFLGDAIPRPWLDDGQTVAVRNAPTAFGPVSYAIVSHLGEGRVEALIDVPGRDPIRRLRLKLRLPAGRRLESVSVNGQPHERFDPRRETIDLGGLTGRLAIVARCR